MLKSLIISRKEDTTNSGVIVSIIPFIKTSNEHRPHAAAAGLVIDDITGAGQPQNTQGWSEACGVVSLTNVVSPGNHPSISVVVSLSGSRQSG